MAQARNNPTETKQDKAPGKAFTLIELLVVIFILSILAALVVGVSVYIMDKVNRDETLANQQIIINAIDKYREITGNYPLDTDGADGQPDGFIPDIDEPTDPDWVSGFILLQYLTGQVADNQNNDTLAARIRTQISKALLDLPEEAMDASGFRDAYGYYMRYVRDGGLGGRPVIISPGGDGDFATTDDNIRSD